MQKQRLFVLEALLEIVAFEQPRHADVRRQFDEPPHAEVFHPFAVEANLGTRGVENLECLPPIGLGVG